MKDTIHANTSIDATVATPVNLVIGPDGYHRNKSSVRTDLELNLVKAYGKSTDEYQASVFPSGMCAITMLLEYFAGIPSKSVRMFCAEPCFIFDKELYIDTSKYISDHSSITTFIVDLTQPDGLEAWSKKYNISEGYKSSIVYYPVLLFAESCSNPSGRTPDYESIRKFLANYKSCTVVIDNTWLSPTGFPWNSLPQVKIVVESLTKYISNGTCIGGSVIASKTIMHNFKPFCAKYGLFVGADHCQLFLNGLSTLKHRMSKIRTDMTTKMIPFLVKKPDLTIHYPWSPTTELLDNSVAPGVVLFHIPTHGSNNRVRKTIKQIERDSDNQIMVETSYGGEYARILITKMENANYYGATRDPSENKRGVWLRFAIGSKTNLDDKFFALLDIYIEKLKALPPP